MRTTLSLLHRAWPAVTITRSCADRTNHLSVRVFAKMAEAPVAEPSVESSSASAPFHKFQVEDIKGQSFNLGSLKGKVVLVVNVASHCGFTKQYTGLQALYDKYKDQGFEILGFPCNQFGGQEPGQPEEIVEFCSRTYSVNFPIMQKVEVNGKNTHPIFDYLKKERKSLMMELVKWNFEKWLIAKDGTVVERYASTTTPESLDKAIAAQLAVE